jgi:hypothetical protein
MLKFIIRAGVYTRIIDGISFTFSGVAAIDGYGKINILPGLRKNLSIMATS